MITEFGLITHLILPKPLADLRPASQIEALVNIQRSISSTVSSMSLQLGTQAAIPGTLSTKFLFLCFQNNKHKVSTSCEP